MVGVRHAFSIKLRFWHASHGCNETSQGLEYLSLLA